MGVPEVAKKKRGGQTIRTQELDEGILAWIADGQTLREFCRKRGNPCYAVVYQWLRADEAFATRFARAREVGLDAIADAALAMSDKPPPKVGGKVDQGYVSWVKNRVWTRLQLLAKWNPKKYGDRIAVSGAEGAPLVQISNADAAREVAMLLATAAARKVLADRETQAKAQIEVAEDNGDDD